jgi:hypothetical protein
LKDSLNEQKELVYRYIKYDDLNSLVLSEVFDMGREIVEDLDA